VKGIGSTGWKMEEGNNFKIEKKSSQIEYGIYEMSVVKKSCCSI
jgi:hypothetical protein